ncbi:flagellar biosynthetic protein FliO [Terribacillus sp. 7520-G]|uniref:flagellar biosynthetic protein FliO n=1 Tax=unclassified Terribacillus TaxID=2636508 RepID=UPI000BA4EE28|nr:flagellar biosynthetic protein FliO [Terribacillus sp. 7520-G]PAD40074.1 flagellar biosynthetic protein FliO [Terribacillus sp. 7520-G]
MMKRTVWACMLLVLMHLVISPISAEAAASVEDCLKKDAAQSEDCKDMNEAGNQQENTPAADSADAAAGGTSTFMNLVKLALALAVVLGLIYVLLKFLNKRNRLFQQVRAMENIGGIALGNNKSVQIVRVGEKVYMLGVGDNVDLLTEIEDEQTIKELTEQDQQEMKASALLANILPGKKQQEEKQQEESAKSDGAASSFQEQFKEEIRKLKQSRNRLEQQQRKDTDDE